MLKKILAALGVIAVIIAALIGGGIGKQVGKEVAKSAFSPSTLSPQQMEVALIKGLTKGAEQINKRGPTMIDKDTRMERASVGPGARATYFYSFPNYSSQDVAPSWLYANLEPEVKRKVCASKEMKPSLQYGATYVFAYSGNNGTEIARFEINKNDCN